MKKKSSFVETIIDILVKHHVISAKEGVGLAIAFDGSPKAEFDEFVIEEGLIDDINVLRALGEYYQVPAFDVVGYFFDYNQLHKFPKGFLLRNAIIPLTVDENIMVVVASNPADPSLLSKIGKHVSYDIKFRVGLRGDICDAVKEYYDKALTEVNDEGETDLDLEAKQRAIAQAKNKNSERYSDENAIEQLSDEDVIDTSGSK